MNILIIEDDPAVSSAVGLGLDEAGFNTTISRDGGRALGLALEGEYELILLDLTLPDMDGLNVCRSIREARMNTPILMVTARDSVKDRVRGLEAGADDYMCKPFEFQELLARIRALLRRERSNQHAAYQVGDLVVDATAKTVSRGGNPVELTAQEYKLLEVLAHNAGKVLSREQILEQAWGDEHTSSNTVDVFVRNLRKKVDADPAHRLIHTVYGRGYVLRADN